MSQPTVDDLRLQLAAARAEVDRLVADLERAEWLRDYDTGEAEAGEKGAHRGH